MVSWVLDRPQEELLHLLAGPELSAPTAHGLRASWTLEPTNQIAIDIVLVQLSDNRGLAIGRYAC